MLLVFMELFAAPISEAVSVVDGPANSYRLCEEVGRYAPASVGPVAVNESGLAGSLDRVGAPPVLSGTAKMMYQGSGAPALPKFQTPNSVNGIGFGCRPHVGAQAADGSNTPTFGSIICPKAQTDRAITSIGNSIKVRLILFLLLAGCYVKPGPSPTRLSVVSVPNLPELTALCLAKADSTAPGRFRPITRTSH